jgi:predicted GIY-YIG superfamily endonuclease
VTIQKTYYVCILASKRNGTLYIGVTNDLAGRVRQHKGRAGAGVHEKARGEDACLFRRVWRHPRSHRTRNQAEEVQARVGRST